MAAFADELMSGAGATQVAENIRTHMGLGLQPNGSLEAAGYSLVSDGSYLAALNFLCGTGKTGGRWYSPRCRDARVYRFGAPAGGRSPHRFKI